MAEYETKKNTTQSKMSERMESQPHAKDLMKRYVYLQQMMIF